MSNFELIDDYLTNRLGEEEKVNFERQLNSDPALRADVDLQKHIIGGVRKARIADLKAMLNNVPVGGGFSYGVGAGKIAAAVVTLGIVGTSLYFYFRPFGTTESGSPEIAQHRIEPKTATPTITESAKTNVAEPAQVQPPKVELKKMTRKSPKNSPKTKSTIANPPKIEAIDPSDELVDNSSWRDDVEGQKSGAASSHIAVETDASNKKYNFHYQFKDGKLVLYGTFDRSLYEILEIHGNKHSVFLFYKEHYYLLNEKQSKITALESINDVVLIRKLKEYRGR